MIAFVASVTIVLFAAILVSARRRRSYASASLSLLAVAYAGVALASCFALWTIRGTFEELARQGGGIGARSFGFWQAARVPLASAWIAVAATLLALAIAFVSRREEEPATPWWQGGVAIAAGVTAVLVFRDMVEFAIDAVIPGRQPWWLTGPVSGYAINSRVVSAGAISAFCCAVALTLAVMMLRRGAPSRRMVVTMLIASVVVSATLVAGLQSYTSRFHATYSEGQPIVSSDHRQPIIDNRQLARR